MLAATFGALSVLPLLFLAQLAFLVGFGVLLDTFVVRSLVVPAAVAIIGDKVWWPSRLREGRATTEHGARVRAGLTPGRCADHVRPRRRRSSHEPASAKAGSSAVGGTGLLSRPSARA